MPDTYEKDLSQKSALTTSDFIRIVGSDNVSYKQSVNAVGEIILSPESLNYTFGNKNWYFTKIGRLVVIQAPADIQSASAGTNNIATLPTEYRPFVSTYFGVQNAGNDSQRNCFLTVTTTGAVNFYTPSAISSAQNCGIAGCYVTNS